MKKKNFIIIFFIFGLTQKSFAYSSDPKQFIQEVVDEAKKVLVEENSKEFKTKKFQTNKRSPDNNRFTTFRTKPNKARQSQGDRGDQSS